MYMSYLWKQFTSRWLSEGCIRPGHGRRGCNICLPSADGWEFFVRIVCSRNQCYLLMISELVERKLQETLEVSIRVLQVFNNNKNGSARFASIWGLLWWNPKGFLILTSQVCLQVLKLSEWAVCVWGFFWGMSEELSGGLSRVYQEGVWVVSAESQVSPESTDSNIINKESTVQIPYRF